ncbi:oligosaccharide biosynthesis protein Alg14 like-domain-containing protein [Crepidotus variabilis]|uniref:UDP-N-acetylglucosamine transferase subunit ALG14 n=1 Tax=Crepidotus variabilis TaxID=179855 RepID=A0A9P6EHW6_9AGAR|nr:oligosaccharide biosynthesis protein Alg14 like-domain-containing protein [Crepidotus variabilis]
MSWNLSFFLGLLLLISLLAIRISTILPGSRNAKSRTKRSASDTCSVAVFLGSGGHTSEALTLMSALDFKRYNKRIYIVSDGDILSARKALNFEAFRGEDPNLCSILSIPRARKVHQSLLSTPISTLYSLAFCVYHLTLPPLLTSGQSSFADVLILNGPGTCFVLCVAVYVNKFLGLPAPKLIYVETFARVKALSLSGKLIRPIADRFVTQWGDSRQQEVSSSRWLV